MHATSGYTSATTSVVPLLLKENARSLRVMNCSNLHELPSALRLQFNSWSEARIHGVSLFMMRSINSWCKAPIHGASRFIEQKDSLAVFFIFLYKVRGE